MTAYRPHTIRVIKLGGSLLLFPKLPSALTAWLSRQTPAINILIVGGGECVEAMRELDALWKLDPQLMHWRCVDLLDATWQIAKELWPKWPTYGPDTGRENADCQQLLDFIRSSSFASDPHGALLVRVRSVYGNSCQQLPFDWRTTTDSIAAYLANSLDASELVLLKSTPHAFDSTTAHAAQVGWVDQAFPTYAPRHYPTRVVHLTSSDFPESKLFP
jgi:aspartokinase-like uncharacterized kinase